MKVVDQNFSELVSIDRLSPQDRRATLVWGLEIGKPNNLIFTHVNCVDGMCVASETVIDLSSKPKAADVYKTIITKTAHELFMKIKDTHPHLIMRVEVVPLREIEKTIQTALDFPLKGGQDN